MTRFARSEGSKASNKREPEEATPWNEQVALLNKGNSEAGVEDDVDYGDYDEDGDGDVPEKPINDSVIGDEEDIEDVDEELDPDQKLGDHADFSIAKKRKVNEENSEDLDDSAPKKKKKNQKCKICRKMDHLKMDCPDLPPERRKELQELFVMKTERKGKGTGRKKTKKKDSSDKLVFENELYSKVTDEKDENDANTFEDIKTETKKDKKVKKDKKAKKEDKENKTAKKQDKEISESDQPQKEKTERMCEEPTLSKAAKNKLKRQKQKDKKKNNPGGTETTEEKPAQKPWKKPVHAHTPNPNKVPEVAMDGTQVEDGEGLFHGFRVKKEDVKRLRELYYEMKEKGIPRWQIDIDIRKERRICEKKMSDITKGQPQMAKDGTVVQEGEGLFHGFRVKKEDVTRLKKLYHDMKNKGIPQEELNAYIKKERRSCENEMNRMKGKVCLNCRQEGHWLAQCPQGNNSGIQENKDSNMKPNSGLCFKCGSLDHTSKDCKSKLKGENAFRFAVCFICKEEGHLAKACPDNPKGLYPNGGGCVFCGSVEHLKRDCPRKVEKDARSEFGTIGTMNGDLEYEPDHTAKQPKKENGPKNKIVSF